MSTRQITPITASAVYDITEKAAALAERDGLDYSGSVTCHVSDAVFQPSLFAGHAAEAMVTVDALEWPLDQSRTADAPKTLEPLARPVKVRMHVSNELAQKPEEGSVVRLYLSWPLTARIPGFPKLLEAALSREYVTEGGDKGMRSEAVELV